MITFKCIYVYKLNQQTQICTSRNGKSRKAELLFLFKIQKSGLKRELLSGQQRNPEHSSLHGLQKITPSGLEFSSLQDLEKVNPSGLEHSIIQGLEKATPCGLVEKLKKIKQERVWCKESHPLNPDLRHPVCFAKQPSGTKQAFLTWLPGESFEELLVVAFFFLQLV